MPGFNALKDALGPGVELEHLSNLSQSFRGRRRTVAADDAAWHRHDHRRREVMVHGVAAQKYPLEQVVVAGGWAMTPCR